MKKVFFISLIYFSVSLQSQVLQDNFKIGNYLEIYNNDSILIYFNCNGAIVDKNCAKFFRKGRIDSISLNVSGEFHDYYLDGTLALRANMVNDYLNGIAFYYHKNGKIKSKGNYSGNIKNGVWTYYYENGQLEKVINFIKGYPLIAEYYSENGKQKVINGNGKYNGTYYAHKGCKPFIIKGKVENGKMEGKWKLINSISLGYEPNNDSYYTSNSNQILGYEIFKDGKFIKGSSDSYNYSDNQKIQINGYCVNENVLIYENHFGCPGDKISWLKYKKNNLNEVFYPELLTSITTNLKNYELTNQWLIIGLRISQENNLEEINVKSSVNDSEMEVKVYEIFNAMKEWKAAQVNDKEIDFDLLFTVLIRDNQIIIPTDYLYRNR